MYDLPFIPDSKGPSRIEKMSKQLDAIMEQLSSIDKRLKATESVLDNMGKDPHDDDLGGPYTYPDARIVPF